MGALLGYRPEELIGPAGASVLPADQRSIAQAADERRARGETDRYELELLCKDGQRIHAEVNGRPRVEDGRFVGSIAVFTDVTERKRAENALRERANRMELIARMGQRTTAILERDELLDQAVELIGAMFGYYNVTILLVDGDHVVLRACLLPSDRPVRLHVGSEGIAGWVAASGEPLLVPDVRLDDRYVGVVEETRTRSELAVPIELKGMVIGVLDVQSAECDAFSKDDVSTLQTVADQLAVALANARLYEQIRSYAAQLEERVAERTAELAAVNRELAAFSYSVSHDLRAPLRSMSGFSEALLEDYADVLDDTGRDFLRRVHQAGRRMAQLIDDLLNLSRLTRSEMSREPVDLSALAQSIAAELQQGEPERKAEFIIAPGLDAIGDPGLLRVLLENLLGNAWKFTGKVAHARIEFGAAEADGDLAYFVRDNGAGFAMTYSDKLFGPFQRLHAESEFPGSGIGLATVQRIVFRHGGRVWAEGEEGRGARFFFTLAARGGGP
jgi:PAS domain S-box-containing protein